VATTLIVMLAAGPAGAAEALPPETRVDRVVIEKALRKLTLIKDEKPVRTYHVALGAQPNGPKRREGDQRTPEGVYTIDARNPRSDFFLSLRISYPNDEDVARARAAGADPGGQIMIHGLPNEPKYAESMYEGWDWTDGCIAVSNSDMIDIWLMTDENTPIEIRP